jgi:MoxR-like ATPase
MPDPFDIPSFLNIPHHHVTRIPAWDGFPERAHVFEEDSIEAVNTALAARRPLLVRGPPGSGKSQLARAVAVELKRHYVQYVVDSRSEARDLLWEFDAVRRLADAQLGKVLEGKESEDPLGVIHYMKPGPLWWAFHWDDALAQTKLARAPLPSTPPCRSEDGGKPPVLEGCVLLLDEIDKAETDVPNGLLEALGEGCFTPMGREKVVVSTSPMPLILITTNEERALPDAFLRRCLVLRLDLFSDAPQENSSEKLMLRGEAHFPDLDPSVLEEAARQLLEDRALATKRLQLPLPGVAEYLDLLRVVRARARGDKKRQKDLLSKLARYVTQKGVGEEF